MPFSYGILCEGDSDLYTLEIICRRIAEMHGREVRLDSSISEPVNGPVSKTNIKAKTRLFMANSVDFGVYVADFDKGTIDKIRLFKESIEAVNTIWLEGAVIGVPNPHLEEWLIKDEDFIKNELGLNRSSPLPHPTESPKNRMKQLVSQNGPDELTVGEFRRIIAEGMSLDILINKSPSFSAFVKSMKTSLNYLNR